MSTAVKIPGSLLAFERDIHQLIDDYATLAAPEGTWDPETGLQLLFSTFKELWKARGMTFIHKAYPGCEHSPDYVQQMFTTALERLVFPSPLAQEGSPLYLLQYPAPPPGTQHLEQQQQQQQQQAYLEPGQAPYDQQQQQLMPWQQQQQQQVGDQPNRLDSLLSLLDFDAPGRPQQQQQQGGDGMGVPAWTSFGGLDLPFQADAAAAAATAAAAAAAAVEHDNPLLATLQQITAAGPLRGAFTHSPHNPTQQQQQQCGLSPGHALPGSPLNGAAAVAAASPVSPPWSPGQMLGVSPFGMGASPLGGAGHLSPFTLGPPGSDLLGPLSPYQATPEGGAAAAQQPVSPLKLGASHGQTSAGAAAGGVSGDGGAGVGDGAAAAAGAAASGSGGAAAVEADQGQVATGLPDLELPTAAAATAAPLPTVAVGNGNGGWQQAQQQGAGQWQQWQQQPPGARRELQLVASSGQQLHHPLPPPPVAAAAGAGTVEAAAAATTALALVAGAGAEREPVAASARAALPIAGASWCGTIWTVPLPVQAAVVYTVYCLHATQVTRPLTQVYVPLRCLAPLAAAAGAFAAAGVGPPLAILQQLHSSGCLVLGGGSRPQPSAFSDWRAPVAAPEDAAAAAAVAQQAAAAKARKRKPQQVQQDIQPSLVREALFHIKATLKGLANFKALQTLCGQYADARAGIFKPLMPLMAAVEAAGGEAAGKTQQRPSAAAGSSGARKRSAAGSDAPPAKAARTGAAAGRSREQRSSAPAAGGTAAAAGEGPAPPVAAPLELFDSTFAGSLQEFAGKESERVLDSLQPPTAASRRATKAAAAAAADDDEDGDAPSGSKYYKGRKGAPAPYQISVFGNAQAPLTAAAAAGPKGKRAPGSKAKAAPSGSVPSHLRYFMDLAAAGVLSEADAAGGAAQVVREDFGLGAAAQRALLQQADRQQQLLMAADTWFAAQDAMMAQQGLQYDSDSDMPEV